MKSHLQKREGPTSAFALLLQILHHRQIVRPVFLVRDRRRGIKRRWRFRADLHTPRYRRPFLAPGLQRSQVYYLRDLPELQENPRGLFRFHLCETAPASFQVPPVAVLQKQVGTHKIKSHCHDRAGALLASVHAVLGGCGCSGLLPVSLGERCVTFGRAVQGDEPIREHWYSLPLLTEFARPLWKIPSRQI